MNRLVLIRDNKIIAYIDKDYAATNIGEILRLGYKVNFIAQAN